SLRPIGNRYERPHQVVDPVDEPPGEADGDVERADQDQAGQEIVAQPADRPTMRGLAAERSVNLRRRGGRHDARVSIKLAHAAAIFSSSRDLSFSQDLRSAKIFFQPSLAAMRLAHRPWRRRYTPKSRGDHSTVTDLARLRG